MMNTISDIQNILEGISCRLDEAENGIRDLKDKVEKNTQSEQQMGKKMLKMSIV